MVRLRSRMLEHPIYIWGCKSLYQDNVTNLVPGLIWASYVTDLTQVTTQISTCKASLNFSAGRNNAPPLHSVTVVELLSNRVLLHFRVAT